MTRQPLPSATDGRRPGRDLVADDTATRVLAEVITLHANGQPTTLGPLVAACGLPRSTVVSALVHLTDAGLVTRDPGTTATLRPTVAVMAADPPSTW